MKRLFICLMMVIALASGCKSRRDVIKIGALISLTGDNAAQGNLAQNGILQYVNQLNENGGINGKKVKLIIENTQTSTNATLSAFKKLATINKVEAIVVTGDTELKAVNTLADTYKIPIVATICTGMIEEGRSKWLYRYCYNEEQEDAALMQFVKEDLGVNDIVLLYPNTQFGLDFYNYSKQYIESNDINLTLSVAYDFSSTNQRGDAIKVMDTKPTLICARGFGSALDALLRHISELGFDGKIVGDLSLTTPSTVNNTNGIMEGAYIVASDLDLSSSSSVINDYASLYRATYKTEPCFWDAVGYDSILYLCEAIKEKENKKISIQNALFTTKPQGLLLGNNYFDNELDVSFEMHIFEMNQGNLQRIK